MKYLLDSNRCIQYLRYGSASLVSARFAGVHPTDVVVCSVVVGELLFGAHRSGNAAKNLADVRTFLAGFRSLPFDDRAADQYAAYVPI